jgi:FAD/FMN-containing dehydrogenase
VNVRVCPRCQTPVQAGGKVCQRCEQPVEGPAHALRYNPAGLPTPSPVQGHATVLVGIVTALALLAFGAWFAFRSVGPFRAEVVRQAVTADGRAVEVELRVVNEGDRQGRARCRITGLGPDGRLRTSEVKLSPTVPGHGSVVFVLRGDTLGDAHDLQSTCA